MSLLFSFRDEQRRREAHLHLFANDDDENEMFPHSPAHSSSGERRSSYQHYSMSQVNNEKPVVQREQEENVQTWGHPSNYALADADRHQHQLQHLTANQNAAYRQRTTSSSSMSRKTQQAGSRHVHDVPFFHGFQFQALPGLAISPLRSSGPSARRCSRIHQSMTRLFLYFRHFTLRHECVRDESVGSFGEL